MVEQNKVESVKEGERNRDEDSRTQEVREGSEENTYKGTVSAIPVDNKGQDLRKEWRNLVEKVL